MNTADLTELLNRFPKADLGVHETPIEPLHRLGARLGIQLTVKRDDTLTLAMGGNKVRQLEYYLGPAIEQGADTVLITGAVQSNFVRLTTAAARKLGWNAVVQLENRVDLHDVFHKGSGNVLLDHLLGAQIHHFPLGEDEAAADANLDRLASDLQAKGRNPYVIHLGMGHPPLGGLGYAQCAAECYKQCLQAGEMPDFVVIPSGSGLTHAGFLSGARAAGWNVPVYGICVRRGAAQQSDRIAKRAAEITTLLGGPARLQDKDILVDDATFAPGYGQMNEQVADAIKFAARDEALLVDPVYTGRGLAGLISLVERGIIKQGQKVMFVHTGGTPALFAYQTDLMTRIKPAIE
jgi:D-cysteine desulfhydrase family pyridoxal phosphate-dependent enzyme